MATPTNYQYSIIVDFTSGLELEQFETEILEDDAIIQTLNKLKTDGDVVIVRFADVLGVDEVTALDALIAAHVPVGTSAEQLEGHLADGTNPHGVTMKQIGPLTVKGDILVYNGVSYNRLPSGNSGDMLTPDDNNSLGLSWIPALTPSKIWSIADIKSPGTNGGVFKKAGWRTRDLTYMVGLGTEVVLSNNQVTLESGNYFIFGEGPANNVNMHSVRLHNITDDKTVIEGTSVYAKNTQTISKLNRVLIIKDGPKTYELQHYCTNTEAGNNGFGVATGIPGKNEIYSVLTFILINTL
jgi:hypothetical protein